MDLRRLREETLPEHEATEAAMPLTAPGLDLATYTSVLELLLPMLQSWETWAECSSPPSMQPLLAARRRSHLLAEDLRSLRAELPNARNLGQPSIDWGMVVNGSVPEATESASEAAFLGAFYVLEGSTLGGRFIARHVEGALGLRPGRGNAYFRGHGEATGELWREITARIVALPDEDAPQLTMAAKRTFAAFGSVLAHLPAPVLTVQANG